jgi:galactokinase
VDSAYNTRRQECEAGLLFFQEKYPAVASFRDIRYDQVMAAENNLPIAVFKRCRFVVEELVRVNDACKALNSNDFKRFGQLMLDCHEGLHSDYEVTCPETDFLVRQAMQQIGVLGARQMGGGFGGCTLNLVREVVAADFMDSMKAAYTGLFGIELKCYPVKLEAGTSLSVPMEMAVP